MATYKLIQDIEAEDKILGPLTLRQFIFGLIAAFFIYISFICVTKGAPFLLFIFAPPAIFCAFFAFPFGRDQPTEVWFLAKLRYWFLPRKRIWNQSGVKELVTITVPKKVERVLTNGLSQTEVQSRLQALANTIDSRGWAIKNVNVYAQPSVVIGDADDRLLDISALPHAVPDDDSNEANDILDPVSSQLAHQMDYLVAQSEQAHHQNLLTQMNTPSVPPPTSQWFIPTVSDVQKSSLSQKPNSSIVSQDEKYLLQTLKQNASSQNVALGHMRSINPLQSAPTIAENNINRFDPFAAQSSPFAPMTSTFEPDILKLASNDDLNVATLAREARKVRDEKDHPDNEVVINLR